MKRIFSVLLTICFALSLCGTCFAAPGTPVSSKFAVTGYDVKEVKDKDSNPKALESNGKYLIKTGEMATIDVYLWCADSTSISTGNFARDIDDAFGKTGSIAHISYENSIYTVTLSELKYNGNGDSLNFYVRNGSPKNPTDKISVTIEECDYKEPAPVPDTPIVTPPVIEEEEPPTACPAPRMIFSIDRPTEPIAAGQDMTLTVYVYNAGTVTIKKPILTLTPSSGLMLTGGVSAFLLDDIAPKKEKSVTVSAQTLSKIDAQSQGLDCSLSFTYYNNISTVDGTASGKLTIPALTSEIEEETTDAKPVPRIILTGYNHGGSIAAGSEQKVSFTFKNTSSTMAIENILLTVTGGSELAISGSTNTFYFESVEAGGSRSVSVPFRASRIVTSPTQDVSLNFEFEYVEGSNRKTGAAKLNISVPLYQPDRFELSEPVVAYVGFVGEETSLTMDYVNKGKTEVSNVEATISGDVDSYNSFVRVGNIPSGKSGTIAFAVTPMLEGDNKATITVSYEDANGSVQERVFETTLSAMAMEPFDPGEWEDPMEPIEEPSQFPWWIIAVALAVVTIIVGVIVSKKKKKAKLAKEQALWDEWDDDDGAAKAVGTTEAKPLPETAGVTEEATK